MGARGFKSDSYCQGYTRTADDPDAWDEDACGWPLSEYLWRDDFHLSTRAHELLAEAAVEVSTDISVSTASSGS